MYDFTIIGGGIIGLSVCVAIYERFPDAKVVLLEKESELASHQTGHNSGVIHSGIYYKPGSLKAKFARKGCQSITAFCQEHEIDHDICGKVIVATKQVEIPILDKLYERGIQNRLEIKKLDQTALREKEPHVAGLAAIHVPSTGIVNYRHVAEAFAKIIIENGGVIKLGQRVEKITESPDEVIVETNDSTYYSHTFINCAGLHSDRLANLAGYHTDMKIVPFRGEYFKLKPNKQHLVKNLIYPVPNPNFPFLGVHFTRMINGEIEAGPNAVLSFKREGYKKTDFDRIDFTEVMLNRGFWKLGKRYLKVGTEEILRSFSKKKFVKSLQELVPDVTENDIIPAPSGVRAQALLDDGRLVDDFHIIQGKKGIHVCNAPSPAATASIEIGKAIVKRIQ